MEKEAMEKFIMSRISPSNTSVCKDFGLIISIHYDALIDLLNEYSDLVNQQPKKWRVNFKCGYYKDYELQKGESIYKIAKEFIKRQNAGLPPSERLHLKNVKRID